MLASGSQEIRLFEPVDVEGKITLYTRTSPHPIPRSSPRRRGSVLMPHEIPACAGKSGVCAV